MSYKGQKRTEADHLRLILVRLFFRHLAMSGIYIIYEGHLWHGEEKLVSSDVLIFLNTLVYIAYQFPIRGINTSRMYFDI